MTKSRLSLSNTEILCEEHLKLQTFLGYCLQVLRLVEIFYQKNTLKNGVKIKFISMSALL